MTVGYIAPRAQQRPDAAAFLDGADGKPELRVAVAERGIDDAELEARISAAVARLGFRKFALLRLPSIPRDVAGKIQRRLLKAEIAAGMRRRLGLCHLPGHAARACGGLHSPRRRHAENQSGIPVP